jgi:uncharacterized protein GlcG (DUF336 family)
MRNTPRFRPTLETLEHRALPALIGGQQTLAPPTLSAAEVETLLRRAAVATASEDAIIAIVDRGGRILGVLVEDDVTLTGDDLFFAVDGAVAKARTAAFFATDAAPLTSRTIQFISQSTITQREVESNPNINDPNSTLRGPGFVAPIGIGGHFPPGVAFAPQVDLFGIEHTNRDSILHPGPDRLKGTTDDIPLDYRFNIDTSFVPASKQIAPPLSYGEQVLDPATDRLDPNVNHYQSRGIATLPGGIPLYEFGTLVGGIGVFFPGDTGFASEENSSLSADHDPTMPDRTLEAEFMAVAAAGGSKGAGFPVGAIGGVPALPGFDIPFGRIDLVGITLDVIGPGGDLGPGRLVAYAQNNLGVGQGTLAGATFLDVDHLGNDLLGGRTVPDGWLVKPHAGVNLSKADVTRIIRQGIQEANKVRAQIRLPRGERTRMVLAVTDRTGEVLGLYRMPDATVFSIDVAVAKARNLAYYNDPAKLKNVDRVKGLPKGVAFTNRTVRYLAHPRFPISVDGTPPAPFSILNDPGVDPKTGLNVGAPRPASAYVSVLGFDAFNPGTNFRDTTNVANQNGVVFFPGSSGVYKNIGGKVRIVGGFGVSGDGVDQDDVVTHFGIAGFGPARKIRADHFFVGGVRLPYLKFPRNPER